MGPWTTITPEAVAALQEALIGGGVVFTGLLIVIGASLWPLRTAREAYVALAFFAVGAVVALGWCRFILGPIGGAP